MDQDPAVTSEEPTTGYKRPKETQRAVILADIIAGYTITGGGILVIAAVMGILVYLISQVLPLFQAGSVTGQFSASRPLPWARSAATLIDEYLHLAVEIAPDGRIVSYHPKSGQIVSESVIDFKNTDGMEKPSPTAIAFDKTTGDFAAGFEDGSIAAGSITFKVEIFPKGYDLSAYDSLEPDTWLGEGAVFSKVAGDQIRKVSMESSSRSILKSGGTKVAALALAVSGSERKRLWTFAVLDVSGGLSLHHATIKANMMTGKMSTSVKSYELPAISRIDLNDRLFITEKGVDILLIQEDGVLYRYNAREPSGAFLAETVSLTSPGVKVTSAAFLAGRQSLVVGASDGGVGIHFILSRPGSGTADGMRVIRARRLEPHKGPVTAIAPSASGKTFLTAGPGGYWLRNGASDRVALRLDVAASSEIRGMDLTARHDGALLATGSGAIRLWKISAPHPEASWTAFFGKVWYEGYAEPSYTWQSSAATDDNEPKLSLMPLIFGTLKATFYSMLFAVPLAILAAVFTSEFLEKRYRSPLKTTMEMMASLPSVALGFVAALVLAPIVEKGIGPVLLCGLTIPLSLITGSLLWQLLPPPVAQRFSGSVKFIAMALSLGAGASLAFSLGIPFEAAFFDGNFSRWLSNKQTHATPFLFMLFLPMAAAVLAVAGARYGGRGGRRGSQAHGGLAAGTVEMGKALALAMSASLVAWIAAVFAQKLGFDPRDGLVGPYAQRNTLIVGFAMGFAVIPIIYTIAEDALSAVPDHLRGASLGCGATLWQTAIWVVVPTAASGIFSAVMIGMGRAVGETMIVVMAAGNTPVMEMNVFGGLRALSANIAVELPEAVVGGTLYRTLFLSGLTLFLMTFVINSVAELVRMRFRKRFSRL